MTEAEHIAEAIRAFGHDLRMAALVIAVAIIWSAIIFAMQKRKKRR